jgi:transposase
MSVASELPGDVESLQALVLSLRAERDAASDENDRLRAIIRELQRARFGRRSERLSDDQLDLGLEDLEQQVAEGERIVAAARKHQGVQPRAPRQLNRGALPASLPREEVVIDAASKSCACCGGALHAIGEDVSERLDVVPARLRVLVVRRPKYACRRCEDGVVQAPAPARLVEGGLPTEALVSQVVISKYADHLPLYRQAQIFARQGIELDRSTLADWVGQAAWALTPLWRRLRALLVASPKLFADETRAPVLDPGRGRTKTGQFWAYARDDRPWGGSDPPAVAYVYAEGRGGEHAAQHLAGFKGTLQVDGYAAYAGLAGEHVSLAFCWAHVRRKFYEIHAAGNAPIASETLQRIVGLYAIEAKIRGQPAAERARQRRQQSWPIVDALKPWLEARLAEVSRKSTIAEAIRYALSRWAGLCRFLDDGHLEIDNNAVERSMRPIALGRKNHHIAGSDGGARHWAVLASLIETAKLNGVDPQAWMTWALARYVDGHPQHRLDELLPWNYAKIAA